jgi:ATP phosphoribosyltransferase
MSPDFYASVWSERGVSAENCAKRWIHDSRAPADYFNRMVASKYSNVETSFVTERRFDLAIIISSGSQDTDLLIQIRHRVSSEDLVRSGS